MAAKSSNAARNAKRAYARANGIAGSERRQLNELKVRFLEIKDLRSAASVLGWDQAVFMPPAGAAARARQKARLSSLAHERATAASLGRLIDKLAPLVDKLPQDDDDAAMIRIARRDYERSVRVPADYVARASAHGSASYQAWTVARPANDFAAVVPFLETSLELSREYANFFPGYKHVMDPLIGPQEAISAEETARLFEQLRVRLVPLMRAITNREPADDSCLKQTFPAEAQLAFAQQVAVDFGYDLKRGRIDQSPHPFCTTFARDDVRITTRVRHDDLSDALFSVLHEVGHALYEQGVDTAFEGTPLANGASAGVHESQSRLWENIVARSLPFWQHYYPRLQSVFPDQLGGVPLDRFHRAINKVERSLIRTDADEVTYNLHVMVRFDLEKAMLEGRLAPRDLRDAWNAAYEADLGVVAAEDRDGVLQDVHWYGGGIGGHFQGYTIGNILSAQIWEAALAARPEIAAEVGQGKFATLRAWLEQSLHRHGRKYTGPELVRIATGQPMSIEPYMRYLEGKFGGIYGV